MMESTLPSSILVVRPGTALLSCTAVGMPSSCAARSTGKQTYPPVPTATSGLNSRRIFFASPVEVTTFLIVVRLCLISSMEKPRWMFVMRTVLIS